ncbi:hypothetical protein [Serratia sp. PL17]|uniref:hypothetical protein n=1 Tax=Serratia sp. PL17 TaxID=2806582 RepID=UPI001AE62609|nr:hypothetical protein [Serratia sp. PL17]
MKDKYFIVKVNYERKITSKHGGREAGKGNQQIKDMKKPGVPGWRELYLLSP